MRSCGQTVAVKTTDGWAASEQEKDEKKIETTRMASAAIEEALQSLNSLAPRGYSAGFRIRFSRPTLFRITYPPAWIDVYTTSNFFLCDPVIAWGITHTGSARWSDIDVPDPFGIFKKAADHDLKFGVAISMGSLSSRSVAGLARDDREFTETEIADAHELVEKIHKILGQGKPLLEIHLEALELYSLGYSYDDICAELSISRTALKSRLDTARKRLGANSNVDAVRIATERSLLRPGVSLRSYGSFGSK